MTDTRSETDSFGAIDVPAAAYWGAQTQRSIENFPFPATERMPFEHVTVFRDFLERRNYATCSQVCAIMCVQLDLGIETPRRPLQAVHG